MDYKILEKYPLYKIYRDGSVKGWNGKYLKPLHGSNNHYKYRLYYESKKYKNEYVHRLVALAFLPNPNNFKCVDHIDRNPKNNNVENLRWCNHSTNMINREISNNCKIPFRHIQLQTVKRIVANDTVSYLLVIIRNQKILVKKRYNILKYTLEDVVNIRNNFYKEFKIDIDD